MVGGGGSCSASVFIIVLLVCFCLCVFLVSRGSQCSRGRRVGFFGAFLDFFGLVCIVSRGSSCSRGRRVGFIYLFSLFFLAANLLFLLLQAFFCRLRSKEHITPSYVDITRCLTCLAHKYAERQCASVEKNALFAGMDAESRLLTGNRPLHSESSTRRIWSGLSVPEEDSRP